MHRGGKIVQFPGRRHERASADSRIDPDDFRAAREAMSAAVTPDSEAVGVPRSDCHHSSGMRSRCTHFLAAETPAPISSAIASGDGQSAMISRNDDGGGVNMDPYLGQSVLNGKAKVSRDWGKELSDNASMADRMSETEEKLAFIGRVRLARLARFKEQKPMCVILGVDQGTYKQYEIRTPLPHRYLPKFCAATGVSLEWLLTGDGKGAPAIEDIPKTVVQPVKRRRRKAA